MEKNQRPLAVSEHDFQFPVKPWEIATIRISETSASRLGTRGWAILDFGFWIDPGYRPLCSLSPSR
jgi:hypothetical protein